MKTTEFVKQLRLALALGERKEVDRLLSLNAFSDGMTFKETDHRPIRPILNNGVFYSLNGIRRRA